MTSSSLVSPAVTERRDPVVLRLVRVGFVASLVLFLLGGFVLVGAQAVEILLGDGAAVTRIAEEVGPPTYVVASVCGLLAFVQEYFRPGRGGEQG